MLSYFGAPYTCSCFLFGINYAYSSFILKLILYCWIYIDVHMIIQWILKKFFELVHLLFHELGYSWPAHMISILDLDWILYLKPLLLLSITSQCSLGAERCQEKAVTELMNFKFCEVDILGVDILRLTPKISTPKMSTSQNLKFMSSIISVTASFLLKTPFSSRSGIFG